MRYLTEEDILASHEAVMAERGRQGVLRDAQQFASNVSRPRWREDIWEAAGVLFHAFAATQVFADGNKGTALAAVLKFLRLNDFRLDATNDELYDLAMRVALHEIDSVDELALFFKEHAEPVPLPED